MILLLVLCIPGRFQHFDWGKDTNLLHYGQEQPPEYDVTKIKVPITMFWANNDWLTSEKVLIDGKCAIKLKNIIRIWLIKSIKHRGISKTLLQLRQFSLVLGRFSDKLVIVITSILEYIKN